MLRPSPSRSAGAVASSFIVGAGFILGAAAWYGLVSPGPVAAEARVITLAGTDLSLPFSPAIESGDFVYLSGALGTSGGELVETAPAQIDQVLRNLDSVLVASGVDRSRVVSAQAYLTDMRRFATMNEIYAIYFGDHQPPVRTTVEAGLALPGAMGEIAMVAARPGVEIEVITPEGWNPSPNFAWGVRAAKTLFVSGMVSFDPVANNLVTDDFASQTRRVLSNIEAVLEAGGLTRKNVAFCNVFLADSRDFRAMNEIYGAFFGDTPPARATVEARLAGPDILIEITCTALDGERQVIRAAGEQPSSSPLVPAVKVGDQLFLSGMVGRKNGEFPPSVEQQTALVLDRLERTLDAAGMDWSHVVSSTVYLSDARYYAAMNEIYSARLPSPRPARATVATPLMSPAAWVEISMVAVDQQRPASDADGQAAARESDEALPDGDSSR